MNEMLWISCSVELWGSIKQLFHLHLSTILPILTPRNQKWPHTKGNSTSVHTPMLEWTHTHTDSGVSTAAGSEGLPVTVGVITGAGCLPPGFNLPPFPVNKKSCLSDLLQDCQHCPPPPTTYQWWAMRHTLLPYLTFYVPPASIKYTTNPSFPHA